MRSDAAADLGAKSELIACTWLMAQGYYVFRNMSPVGPIDLIACSPSGRIIKIDVKTTSESENKSGRAIYRLKRKQEVLGVQMLAVFPSGKCVLIPSKPFKPREEFNATSTIDKAQPVG